MKRVAAALVVVAALAAVPAGAGSARTAARGCTPRGETLARNSAAVVYATGGTAYGCAQSVGTAFELGSTGFCNRSASIDHLALAGTTVAYGLEQCGVDTGSTMIEVHRLTDNHAVQPVQPAVSGRLGPEPYESIGSLVVRRDGAVAWIASGASIVGIGPKPVEVHRVNRNGRQRLLDSGAAIAIGSLRLHGSTLTWRHGAAKRHATLP